MDKAHKQRLVGGIVLVALGLILIPTILDFTQEARDPVVAIELPESPDVMKMEVLPLEVWSEPVDPGIDSVNRIVETPTADQEPAVEAPSSASEPPAGQSPETTAPPPEKVVKPAPKPERDSAVDIPAGATAWVVQIASFSDESKAFRLRDRLRQAGNLAFIERGRNNGGVIYRVKVGPVLTRAEADRLKKQVAEQTKLDGLVMQYR